MANAFLRASTALSLVLVSAAAQAEVTPEQVWQDWQDFGKLAQQTYTPGSVSQNGDTLTVTDLDITAAGGPGQSVALRIPEVTFTDLGDGTVEIITSPAYDVKITGPGPSGAPQEMVFSASMVEASTLASGDPGAISYDFEATAMVVTGKGLQFEADAPAIDMTMTLANPAMGYIVKQGSPMSFDGDFSADTMDLALTGAKAGTSEAFTMTGKMTGLSGTGATALVPGYDQKDFAKALAEGFSTAANFAYTGGGFDVSATDPNGSTTQITSKSSGGNFDVELNKDRMLYGVGAKSVTLTAGGTAIPIPGLTASYDNAKIELQMPIAKSDAPMPFSMITRLEGLKVADVLWGIIDPGATLPRDPATLVIEVDGQASPKASIFDEAAFAAASQAGPPFTLENVNIKALQLTIAGAELKGNGAVTFDNTQPPALGGAFPFPAGKINLDLSGANTLLGKLLTLGLVEPQVSMSFGLFSSMLARPGPTPDTLVSEIEFKDNQILANGQPLPFGP